MKRVLTGFLIFTCLFFSATRYLRLFGLAYGSTSNAVHSSHAQVEENSNSKSSFETKLKTQVKRFGRYFQVSNAHFILNVELVVQAWSCIGLLLCFIVLFFRIEPIAVSLRSPPARLLS